MVSLWDQESKIPIISISLGRSIEVQASAVTQEKEIKATRIGRKERKLSQFTEYTQNFFKIIYKLLELVHELSKTVGYKVNLKLPTAFWQSQQNDNQKTFKDAIYNSVLKSQISINKSKIRCIRSLWKSCTTLREIREDLN